MSKCAKRGLLLAAVASSRRSFARVALAALAVTLLWMGGDEAQADSFNPSFTWRVDDTVADTPSDFTIDVDFPEGDVYYSFWVDFWPTAWQVTPSSEVGLGVQRVALDVVLQAGLLGNPCNTQLPVHWDMLNATTDKSQTVTYEDGFKDSNGDGNPDFIDMYPDFNDRILGPAQPFVREAGIADMAGAKILQQFLIFEPGATIRGQTLDPALGRPIVALLEYIGDPEVVPRPSTITDTCSPLDITVVVFGTAEDGTVLVKNPKQAGTYTWSLLLVGLRDADGDGHENTLDTCPLDPDPTWDPRATAAIGPGDADGDGLPSSCDPDDNDPTNDEDGDTFPNREDNCPLVANGVADADNQQDSDLDGIGDACDPNPDDADTEGEAPQVLLSQDVTITAAGAATPSPTAIATPPPATATPLLAASPTAAPAAETIAPTVIAPPAGGAGSTSGTSWPWWLLAAAVGGTAAAAAGVLLAYRRRKAKA
jgi:hypothetical protein